MSTKNKSKRSPIVGYLVVCHGDCIIQPSPDDIPTVFNSGEVVIEPTRASANKLIRQDIDAEGWSRDSYRIIPVRRAT